MPYIVDGHNLIARVPGINLDDPDDESQLIRLLRSFCARTGKSVTVYFDQRAPGSTTPPRQGGLEVHFITPPRTADEAIRDHIRKLGREAKNWTIVTSDHLIQEAAGHAGAQTLSSHAFVPQLTGKTDVEVPEKPDPELSDEEIAEWLSVFHRKPKGK